MLLYKNRSFYIEVALKEKEYSIFDEFSYQYKITKINPEQRKLIKEITLVWR